VALSTPGQRYVESEPRVTQLTNKYCAQRRLSRLAVLCVRTTPWTVLFQL
jgi:hypothetical protein